MISCKQIERWRPWNMPGLSKGHQTYHATVDVSSIQSIQDFPLRRADHVEVFWRLEQGDSKISGKGPGAPVWRKVQGDTGAVATLTSWILNPIPDGRKIPDKMMISGKEDSPSPDSFWLTKVTWPPMPSRLPRDLLPPITVVKLYFAALEYQLVRST